MPRKSLAARHAGSILTLRMHEKAALDRERLFRFYAGMDKDWVTNKARQSDPAIEQFSRSLR
ncbi:hypothetical protein DWU98_04560 [Dyella monticola]|uniref:Uncharacterized protein n=1 Tax=Dyella monticola TaxID=1927958 RepID=A0A370X5A3_9GAMM|nr:hypothetical protein [Dyella monticola]RDS83609.1 hypothetical protein DWU98_04560 [Dyella monticola]